MNVSRGSDHSCSYVSMIKIDGRPILPPILSEVRRAEMRRYRELAIRAETNQKFRKRDRRVQYKLNEELKKDDQLDSKDSTFIVNDNIPTNNIVDSISTTGYDLKSTEVQIPVTVDQSDQSNNGSSSGSSYSEDFDEEIDSPTARSKTNISDKPIPVVTQMETKQATTNSSALPTEIYDTEPTTITTTTNTTLLFKEKGIPPEEDEEKVVNSQLNDSRRHLIEDDNKSESMSLVSLDLDEEAQRREMEKVTDDEYNDDDNEEESGVKKSHDGNGSDENNSDVSSSSSFDNFLPASGRSSTETFIIERHNTSDSDNNNEFPTPRKYFFSPPPGESGETSIIMCNNNKGEDNDNDDASNTLTAQSEAYEHVTSNLKDTRNVKQHQPRPSVYSCKRYFDSPSSTTSTASQNENTVTSISNDNNTVTDNSFASSSSQSLNSPYASNNSSKNVTVTINPYATSTTAKASLSSSFNYDAQQEKENIMMTPPPTISNKTPRTPPKTAPNLSSPKQSSPQFRPSGYGSKRYFASPVSSRSSQDATPTDFSAPTPYYTPPSLASPKSTSTIATNLSGINNIARSGFKLSPSLRVMEMDSIYRSLPKRELRIPPQALDPSMKPKFDRISAAAKGYLVRRILRTEKIQMIIQTIRDTVELVLKLHEEVPQLRVRNGTGIKPEDAELCRRLFQQLTGACQSFNDVFFKLTTTQRMAIIANDREKIKAKELKNYMTRSRSGDSALGPKSKRTGGVANISGRKLSNATVKSMERRLTIHN